MGAPGAYTRKHLAEKILTSKAALEGERKQVTVLFADLKGSMELLADRDPEEARKILDLVRALSLRKLERRLRDLVPDSLVIGDRLYRGVCRALYFSADAAAGETTRAKGRYRGGRLEEWLVQAGSGQRVAVQSLPYICWRQGSTRYELLTNVLDARRLSAEEALLLYPYRWSIERMFFDLKEVLNLKHFYAANPNAVAMQVYAAAIVYNALRLAQSEAAAVGGIDPEEISPAKFYPKVATACTIYLHRQQWEDDIRQRHPRTHFRLLGPRPEPWAHTGLPVVCREKRRGIRRKRWFCRARRRWKSLAHVRGGKRLIHLS